MEQQPTAEIRNTRGFPFRWVLPVVQLVVCLIALWPARGLLLMNFYRALHPDGVDALGPSQPVDIPVQVQPDGSVHVTGATKNAPSYDEIDRRLTIPLAMNLPAMLIQLPYVILSADKQEWHPQGTLIQAWRATVLPFAGMIFWWFAGRGLEGFFSAIRKSLVPKITWLEFAFAAAMFLFGTGCVIGVYFSPPSDRKDLLTLAAGFALWAALSVPILFAKILQRRLTKAAPQQPKRTRERHRHRESRSDAMR